MSRAESSLAVKEVYDSTSPIAAFLTHRPSFVLSKVRVALDNFNLVGFNNVSFLDGTICIIYHRCGSQMMQLDHDWTFSAL